MNEEATTVGMTDKQAVESYLADEKVTANLLKWAEHIAARLRNNWLTKDRLVKKTSIRSIDEANQILGLLILKGYAVQKNDNGVVKYKITLDKEVRVKLLREHLETIESQANVVRTQIEELEKEIVEMNKK